MGRLGTAEKSRKAENKYKSSKRNQRSVAERSKRLDDASTERKVKRVIVEKQLPTEEETRLLTSQISQSSRLPVTARALCALIRTYAGSTSDEKETRKRPREEANPAALHQIANDLLALRSVAAVAGPDDDAEESASDNEKDIKTVFVDIMESEYGQNTLYTLLTALNSTKSEKFEEIASALLDEFEDNEYLVKHHIACRLMSTLSFLGSNEIQKRVLSLFQQRATSEEEIVSLLQDRHTSTTIVSLLRRDNKETRKWLQDALLLSNPPKKEKKEEAIQRISMLIEDPVATRVIRLLIDEKTRTVFLQLLDVNILLSSKRGSTFLRDLFSFEDATVKESEVAPLISAILEKFGDELYILANDKRANFVLQKIIVLTRYGGVKGADAFQTIIRLLAPRMEALTVSKVGVHVVHSIAETSFHFSPQVIDNTASAIITHKNMNDLLFCQFGSLAVRALMPLVKKEACKSSALLKGAIERNLDDLIFHEWGNLVVQRYFKEVGVPTASAFAKKLIKDPKYFITLCKDTYASHVVFSLLDSVDAPAHTALSNTIKNNAQTLATHVNGRFLVEKVISASSELRSELLRQFIPLALEKGTQHILCSLVGALDQRGIENLLSQLKVNLKRICTQQSGSIAVQKIMQSNAEIKAGVSKELKNEKLRSELLQNYYGKFVVMIADN